MLIPLSYRRNQAYCHASNFRKYAKGDKIRRRAFFPCLNVPLPCSSRASDRRTATNGPRARGRSLVPFEGVHSKEAHGPLIIPNSPLFGIRYGPCHVEA